VSMQQYRVCLADRDLNQVTFWEWLDETNSAHWPTGIVPNPVMVHYYLVHDTYTDMIRVCDLDVPMRIHKDNTLHFNLGTLGIMRKWAHLREVSPH
jgi:hypothetical protein